MDYSMENRTYRFYWGEPLYPFGHGLTYSNISEEWEGHQVTVTNLDDYDTDYYVLRFENLPQRQLTGFRKVLLKKGQSRVVQFGVLFKPHSHGQETAHF